MSGVPQRPDRTFAGIAGDQTWLRRNLVYAVILPAIIFVGAFTLIAAWRAGFHSELARQHATDRMFLAYRRPVHFSDLDPLSIARRCPGAASYALEKRGRELQLILRDAAGAELEARRLRTPDIDVWRVLSTYAAKTGNSADSLRVVYPAGGLPYVVIYSSDLVEGSGLEGTD